MARRELSQAGPEVPDKVRQGDTLYSIGGGACTAAMRVRSSSMRIIGHALAGLSIVIPSLGRAYGSRGSGLRPAIDLRDGLEGVEPLFGA